MISSLFSPKIFGAQTFHSGHCETPADPLEEAYVRTAGPPRRSDFRRGRACAHAALTAMGLPTRCVPVGARGEPRWPPGVVGSITHCAGYQAASVGHATDWPGLGLDAEPHQPLRTGLPAAKIATGAEHAMLADLRSVNSRLHWDRLLFSAKEAAYKCQPGSRPFAPLSMRVNLHADGRFDCFDGLCGRWQIRNGLVVALAVSEASRT